MTHRVQRRISAGSDDAAPEHGRRLADLLPDGRLVEIPDSYTVIPLDQPQRLAGSVSAFTRSTADPDDLRSWLPKISPRLCQGGHNHGGPCSES